MDWFHGDPANWLRAMTVGAAILAVALVVFAWVN